MDLNKQNKLVNCMLDISASKAAHEQAIDLPNWNLTSRHICDLELILNGAFSPLDGFMKQNDYQSVLDQSRLADGSVWPMPICLDVDEAFAKSASQAKKIALRDPEGLLIAIMDIEDCWQPDLSEEAEKFFSSKDSLHPGVNYLLNRTKPYYLGGRLYGVQLPTHYDFRSLRHTPAELRAHFEKSGWEKVVAFQTRNPMHRAHLELTFRAAQQAEANLLIHPVVGMTKPGDVDHYTRVRCYERLLGRYPEQTTYLSLLPLAMRMAGPREALWHALIRKNYGCTHFIVGRDHAGPGKNAAGEDFYGPYDAQDMVAQYQDEIGIEMLPFQMMVYVQEKAQYCAISDVNETENPLSLSGTELRRRLQEGLDIPEWFSYPEIVEELRKRYPPKKEQGFTLLFTGLSGSGKSTIAQALMSTLLENGQRPVTLLDGDVVRKNLSSELGFSHEHRNLNVLRIGYVASEITKNGGVAICAPIAPYSDIRAQVRENIEPYGCFIEIHVSTPLEVCEQRDRKGLYAAARAGKIKQFTGISDPYEAPEKPDLDIDTSHTSPEQAVQRIMLKLESMGLIAPRTRTH